MSSPQPPTSGTRIPQVLTGFKKCALRNPDLWKQARAVRAHLCTYVTYMLHIIVLDAQVLTEGPKAYFSNMISWLLFFVGRLSNMWQGISDNKFPLLDLWS